MAKNEKTSKRISSKAGRLMKEIDRAILTLIEAKSVVASALTQAPDKKKK